MLELVKKYVMDFEPAFKGVKRYVIVVPLVADSLDL